MLEMVSRDVKRLKDRQDLLFRKQDMLQSTLAGEVEIPVGQAHSRSVSSILAWSSEPGSPAHPRFERPRETPPVKQPLPEPEYSPVYAPPAHSLMDSHSVYAYSIDDVSSFLSEQWEGPAADTASVVTHGSFVPPAVSLQGAGPSQQTTPYCPLPDVQLSELSCVSGPRNTINPLPLNTSVSQNSPSTNRGVSENPPLMNRSVSQNPLPTNRDISGNPLPMNSGVSGNPLPEPSNCSPASQLPERGAYFSVQVDETLLQQVFTEANLISAYDLFETKAKQGKHLSLSNVGRFGVLLARCCFFGDDVLQTSTLKGRGKGSRPGLDPHKLHALMMEIHRQPAFSSLSMDDFNRTVKVKIEQSLRDYLKPSGSISKRV